MFSLTYQWHLLKYSKAFHKVTLPDCSHQCANKSQESTGFQKMQRTIVARNRKYINYSIHQILSLSCLLLQKSLEVFKRTENKKLSLSSKLWTWYATFRFLQWFGSARKWYNHQENKEPGEHHTSTWNVSKLGFINSVGHMP